MWEYAVVVETRLRQGFVLCSSGSRKKRQVGNQQARNGGGNNNNQICVSAARAGESRNAVGNENRGREAI